jgi:hypothetical protein
MIKLNKVSVILVITSVMLSACGGGGGGAASTTDQGNGVSGSASSAASASAAAGAASGTTSSSNSAASSTSAQSSSTNAGTSASGAVIMPLEVMTAGSGKVISVTLTVPGGAAAKVLTMKVNNLSYDGKGSVQINGGNWINLTNANVTVLGNAKLYGGIGGGYDTISLDVPISVQ